MNNLDTLKAQLAEIERLDGEATPGTWEADLLYIDQVVEHPTVPGELGVFTNSKPVDTYDYASSDGAGIQEQEDAALIVALRNAVTLLLRLGEVAELAEQQIHGLIADERRYMQGYTDACRQILAILSGDGSGEGEKQDD